jgi:hypothetical protein
LAPADFQNQQNNFHARFTRILKKEKEKDSEEEIDSWSNLMFGWEREKNVRPKITPEATTSSKMPTNFL